MRVVEVDLKRKFRFSAKAIPDNDAERGLTFLELSDWFTVMIQDKISLFSRYPRKELQISGLACC